VRRLLLDGEIIDEGLGVLGLERDDARELAFEVRVVRVEAVGDEVRVLLVLREDNRLAESVAAGHANAARHEVLQHLVDCVLVEQPLVDRFGLDAIGNAVLLIPLERVPLVLVVLGQLVVRDAFTLELERH
jgi:hypothetical protein